MNCNILGAAKKIAVKKFQLNVQNSVMYYFKYKTTNITGIPRGKNHELNRNDSYSTVSYYEPARSSKM